ncbi:hypothetical protein JD276_12855 [Leucobacter sp. CSA1]|uniref:Uncharacterized protein n=1 Tax=Leucobacter chromiisoli TaxID=2796471 RepID=A0A934Q8Q9_9MICO|nr:hypothetical protein [Leucobacter chromiisoli]MBK0419921.1 hypothetical protein [Leucobacter chromiisoli]
MTEPRSAGDISFITQQAPVDERGRALYAIARSILRAQLDQLTHSDLEDLDRDRADVTMRQLAKMARLNRDKGMRGDGFEWAVHEAILGEEPSVLEPLVNVMKKASPPRFRTLEVPRSLLFGYERAKYLGFIDAMVEEAADMAVLLPDGQGRPFKFDTWVSVAAGGKASEPLLRSRIKQIWKTDLFLSDEERHRHLATTIKSNWHTLEGGAGLRVAIVPEAPDLRAGVRFSQKHGLWLTVLPDPGGFMGLFNDAYEAVAEAIYTLGKHERGHYFYKPTPMGRRLQEQLEKYPTAKVVDIEYALNEAAQQQLVGVERRLVSVDAPGWLHLNASRVPAVAPKPYFEPLD